MATRLLFPIASGVPLLLWSLGLCCTWAYASNVPYWDSWEYTELIAGEQSLTLAALWQQHNEHRLVFQTLFEVGWGRYAHWNLYLASFFPGVLLGVNSSLVIAGALRSRQNLSQVERTLLITTLSLILFTFRQYVHFIHEMVMCWGILALAMTLFASAFVAYLKRGRGPGMLLVLLVVAALSTGQGLALAVFVLIAGALGFIFRGRVEPPLPRSYASLAVASAALLAVYFVGYVKPKAHPPVTSFLTQPLDALEYLAVLVGSPFAWSGAWAMRIGIALVIVFATGLVVMVRRQGPAALWRVVAGRPLILVNGIVMCAFMVGRVGFGPGQAVASHYVPFNALFVVAALLLAFDQLKGRFSRTLVLGAMVMVLVPTWYLGSRQALQEVAARRDGLQTYRNCVIADPSLLAQCDGSRVYPDPEILARRTALLRDHGLSFFADRR